MLISCRDSSIHAGPEFGPEGSRIPQEVAPLMPAGRSLRSTEAGGCHLCMCGRQQPLPFPSGQLPCHPSPCQPAQWESPRWLPTTWTRAHPVCLCPSTIISWPGRWPQGSTSSVPTSTALWPLPSRPKPSEHTQGQTEAPVPFVLSSPKKGVRA